MTVQPMPPILEPRCPGCGEERLVDLDTVRRRYVCFVCSRTWRAVELDRGQTHG